MPVRLLVRKLAVGSSTDVPKFPLAIRLSAGLANHASSLHGRFVCAHKTAIATNTSRMGMTAFTPRGFPPARRPNGSPPADFVSAQKTQSPRTPTRRGMRVFTPGGFPQPGPPKGTRAEGGKDNRPR